MSTTSTTAIAVITSAEFQALGFTLVRELSTEQTYINKQYTLTYDTMTRKVAVVYGKGRTIYDFRLVTIVNNANELEQLLIRNGIDC